MKHTEFTTTGIVDSHSHVYFAFLFFPFLGILIIVLRRVSDPDDQKFLLDTLTACCKQHFKLDLSRAFGKRIPMGAYVTNQIMRNLMFGNFMEPDAEHKTYDEIEDWSKLEKIIQYYLNEHNRSESVIPMNLTLFKYSIEHIARASRALQMPQGHLLAVGDGDLGRRTAIKLAACMAGAELFEFDFKESYTMDQWKEDIKQVLLAAGLNARPTILMYPDPNVRNASDFMNDIVIVMDNSELPNLFESDDKSKIMDAMQSIAKKMVRILDVHIYSARWRVCVLLVCFVLMAGSNHRHNTGCPV